MAKNSPPGSKIVASGRAEPLVGEGAAFKEPARFCLRKVDTLFCSSKSMCSLIPPSSKTRRSSISPHIPRAERERSADSREAVEARSCSWTASEARRRSAIIAFCLERCSSICSTRKAICSSCSRTGSRAVSTAPSWRARCWASKVRCCSVRNCCSKACARALAPAASALIRATSPPLAARRAARAVARAQPNAVPSVIPNNKRAIALTILIISYYLRSIPRRKPPFLRT